MICRVDACSVADAEDIADEGVDDAPEGDDAFSAFVGDLLESLGSFRMGLPEPPSMPSLLGIMDWWVAWVTELIGPSSLGLERASATRFALPCTYLMSVVNSAM